MTQIRKIVAMSAAAVGVALCPCAFAQDDLDDLLKDLESEASAEVAGEVPAETAAEPKAETTETTAEPVAESETAEESETEAAETAEAEAGTEASDESAEEPAEESADETSEEKAEADESAEDPAAEPSAAEGEKEISDDQITSVLKALGAEADLDKPKAVDPNAELLSNLATTERVRRKALDAQAMREIVAARECLKVGEYVDAVSHYGNATKLLNDRAAVKNLRKECETGMAEGLYRAALQEDDLGRRERAMELMTKAVEMRHPRARRVLEKWADEKATKVVVADKTEMNPKNEAKYKAAREQIRRHLKRSVYYLSIHNMEKALEECEVVLVNDPYNEQAIRIRGAIERKRQQILAKERKSARDGMIADVDQAWRPVYAVNAAQLGAQNSETVKKQTGDDPERTMEQDIERRMKEMKLPNISFKPPATIIDAVEYFRQASKDYDRPDIPAEKRGFNFVLRTPQGALKQQAETEESNDFSSNDSEEESASTNGLEPISTITASDISFYEALSLVCDSVGYKFIVRGQVVMVMPFDMSTAELIARKYNVPEAFVERVSSATDEMKQMGGFGANNASRKKASEEDAGEEQDWKAFFEEMGVKWPEGSSIKHIKALGKLYVRNTRENLAEFEKVLDELGGQPQLIEIETRFVEVSQEDLNSLGFEWILNSDYNLGLNGHLAKALGVSKAGFTDASTGDAVGGTTGSGSVNVGGQQVQLPLTGAGATSTGSSTKWTKGGTSRNVGLSAFGGTDSDLNTNNRYLSTAGNHISGQSQSTNDRFMKVSAFLGNADLSMILHMLSQRSDTDLLSAPKIVTKSGENAVIKVVTEFIYPQDYDVQLQSSSSSSGSSNGGSQSAVLAVVEPQNFTMREVGVILDVTPTYSEANGGTIELELKPQVVDEPTWKNYGMKIPFTGNSSLQNFEGIGGIFDGLAASINAIGSIPQATKDWIIKTETEAARDALDGLTKSNTDNMTYYDAPMEQPFFHVRSIDSKVSITPGATVVMGGLITEQRKAMDDKIPFLGDLPFIGRLFRSHAEQTNKRNLLIFVTGRLITPSGRELKMTEGPADDAEVKPAPQAN